MDMLPVFTSSNVPDYVVQKAEGFHQGIGKIGGFPRVIA